MAGFFNQQINNGMPGRSWRSFMQHIPGAGGGMYGADNGMGMGKSRGMMPRPVARPLQQAAQAGRHGDTILAHINPAEAALLHQTTDGMSINPKTGLPEFWTGEGDTDNGAGPGVATDGTSTSAEAQAAAQDQAMADIAEAAGIGPGQTNSGGVVATNNDMMQNDSMRNVIARNALALAAPMGTVAMGLAQGLGHIGQAIGADNSTPGAPNAPSDSDPFDWSKPQAAGAPAAPASPASAWTSPSYYRYQPARRGFMR